MFWIICFTCGLAQAAGFYEPQDMDRLRQQYDILEQARVAADERLDLAMKQHAEAEKQLKSGVTGAILRNLESASDKIVDSTVKVAHGASEAATEVKNKLYETVNAVKVNACSLQESAQNFLETKANECYDSWTFKTIKFILLAISGLATHTSTFGPLESLAVVQLMGIQFFDFFRGFAILEGLVYVCLYKDWYTPLVFLVLLVFVPAPTIILYAGFCLLRLRILGEALAKLHARVKLLLQGVQPVQNTIVPEARRLPSGFVEGVAVRETVPLREAAVLVAETTPTARVEGVVVREARVEGSMIHQVAPSRYIAGVHRAKTDSFVGLIWRYRDWLITPVHVLLDGGDFIKTRQGSFVLLPKNGWKINLMADVAAVKCSQKYMSTIQLGMAKGVSLPRKLMNVSCIELDTAACGSILAVTKHAPYSLLHSCSTTGAGSSGAPLVNESGNVVAMHIGAMVESEVNTCVFLVPIFRNWGILEVPVNGSSPRRESYGEDGDNSNSVYSEEDERERRAERQAERDEEEHIQAQQRYQERYRGNYAQREEGDEPEDRAPLTEEEEAKDYFAATGRLTIDEGTREFELHYAEVLNKASRQSGAAETFTSGKGVGKRKHKNESVVETTDSETRLNGETAPAMVPASGSSMQTTPKDPQPKLPALSELVYVVGQALATQEGQRLMSQALATVDPESLRRSSNPWRNSLNSRVALHSLRGGGPPPVQASPIRTMVTVNTGGKVNSTTQGSHVAPQVAGQNLSAPVQHAETPTLVRESKAAAPNVAALIAGDKVKSRSARKHAAQRAKKRLLKAQGGLVPLVQGAIPTPSKRAAKRAAKAAKQQAAPAPQVNLLAPVAQPVAKLSKAARRRQNQKAKSAVAKQVPPPPNPLGNRRARRAAQALLKIQSGEAPGSMAKWAEQALLKAKAGGATGPFGRKTPMPKGKGILKVQLGPGAAQQDVGFKKAIQRQGTSLPVKGGFVFRESNKMNGGAQEFKWPENPLLKEDWPAPEPLSPTLFPSWELPPAQDGFRMWCIDNLDHLIWGNTAVRDQLCNAIASFQEFLAPPLWTPPMLPLDWTECGPMGTAQPITGGYGQYLSHGSSSVSGPNDQGAPAPRL